MTGYGAQMFAPLPLCAAAIARRLVPLLALALVTVSCGSDTAADTQSNDSTGEAALTGLTRDDLDCSPEGLGEDASATFTVAHYVVDGELGAVCLGEEDKRLLEAWEILQSITPAGQLTDLGIFAAFEGSDADEETTLAFVNTLDDDGSIFQMSINLDAGDEDPNELALTIAHEFTHVFTAVSTQIDRFVQPEDCDTYDNGEGCYEPDSVMAQWIELFWGNGLIDEIDPTAEASNADGEERCSINPSFFGPYAASNPEEDFAESFSAFVFDLTAATPEQQAKLDWIEAQPGLAEFRQLAAASNIGPIVNNFEPCG